MTKHLYALANNLQSALRRAAGDTLPPVDWSKRALRVHLDAWATLWRWHQVGEPIIRITEEAEDAIISGGLPASLRLADAPLSKEALACQLPDRSQWVVIARHSPGPCTVQVWEQHGWTFAQPVLTYCANTESGGIMSGFVNLIDMPTVADLRLIPGKLITKDGRTPDLTESEVTEDEYRLHLAIHSLYSRTK